MDNIDKEQDKLNKYAYTEANRKVFSLNQSDEKLKRGKLIIGKINIDKD